MGGDARLPEEISEEIPRAARIFRGLWLFIMVASLGLLAVYLMICSIFQEFFDYFMTSFTAVDPEK